MPPTSQPAELFGTASCPYTAEMREHLELEGRDYIEYDVESDPDACVRMLTLTGGKATVPVLVEEGRVSAIGWRGRGCAVAPPPGRQV